MTPLLMGLILAMMVGAFIVLFPCVACPRCQVWPGNLIREIDAATAKPDIPCGTCGDREQVTPLRKWLYRDIW